MVWLRGTHKVRFSFKSYKHTANCEGDPMQFIVAFYSRVRKKARLMFTRAQSTPYQTVALFFTNELLSCWLQK